MLEALAIVLVILWGGSLGVAYVLLRNLILPIKTPRPGLITIAASVRGFLPLQCGAAPTAHAMSTSIDSANHYRRAGNSMISAHDISGKR